MTEIISGIGSMLRPAAKQLIKGGLVATNAISGLASDTGDQFKGLVMEARTELKRARITAVDTAQSDTEGIWDRMVDAGHTAWDATTSAANSVVSTANEGIAMLVAWFTGESKAKAERQVEKDEATIRQWGKDIAGDLAKEECVNVIETVILLAA